MTAPDAAIACPHLPERDAAPPPACPHAAAQHPPSRPEETLEDAAARMYAERLEKARLPPDLQGLTPRSLLSLVRPQAAPAGVKLAPSPPAKPIVGHFTRAQMNTPLPWMAGLAHEYGGIVRLRLGALNAHLVRDPELVQEILVGGRQDFHKHTRGQYMLRRMLGDGLLTAMGEHWRRQRRIAQPSFHRKRINAFDAHFARAAEAMVEGWREGEAIDIHREMMSVTLRVVCETLLGTTISRTREVGDAITILLQDMDLRLGRLFPFLSDLPGPARTQAQEAVRTLDLLVLDIIRKKRASSLSGDTEQETGQDLVTLMMHSVDEETGEVMSDTQLRDEVMTIFLAGHETTANALTWTLHLLSHHPEIARRCRQEVLEVVGDRAPTSEDFSKLTYLHQVLLESMRIFPPAPILARGAARDRELGGYFIPQGSLLLLSPWLTHRDPAHWENPEGFDPSRFEPAKIAARHRMAYFPFGGGQRKCIGEHFAVLEATMILTIILRRWRLDEFSGQSVIPEVKVTMRPQGGLKMIPRRHS